MKKRAFVRRADRLFLLGCAGVLAAGMAVVGAAGLTLPKSPVGSRTALPVYSALGAEGADVRFWPEQLWEEGSVLASGEAEASLVSPWTQILVGGWQPGEVLEAGPGTLFFATADEGLCFFLRDVHFTAEPVLVGGMPTDNFYPHPLTAQLAVGSRAGQLGVVCRVFAREGYDDLPQDWQEAAAQRCFEELLYLFNLSNDDQRTLLYHQLGHLLTDLPWPLEAARFPSADLTEYWEAEGRERLGSMLETLRWRVKNGQGLALMYYNDYGWQDPGESGGSFYNHVPLYADPMPGEKELARVTADLQLDVQILPQEKQVMILFGWEDGSLAVYYDPVLECFTGFAVQG